jgi:glycosyltransferase involved in cell wall biosynthesis
LGVSPAIKVLQLSKKVPFQMKDGESMAICSLAESMVMNGFTVDLLSLNTKKHKFTGSVDKEKFSYYNAISMVDINTSINLYSFITNLFSAVPYQICRFVNVSFKSTLIDCLYNYKYDYIILETIYLTPYIAVIKKYSKAKIVLRTHNLEYEIWDRLYEGSKMGLQKFLYKVLSYQIYLYESKHLREIDFLIAISQREFYQFNQFYPEIKGMVMPITWNSKLMEVPIENQNKDISLYFMGSLDWKPNQEGLLWFLNHIWPMVHSNFPDLTFHVAGRNMPDDIKQIKIPGVVMVGEVEDAAQFVKQHDICIVPLLSGSGMRAKIIEAMAIGKVVVTTTIGLEGIVATNGYDVFIADTPNQFIEQILNLITVKNRIRQIGLNAQETIKINFDSEIMGNKLITFLNNYNN